MQMVLWADVVPNGNGGFTVVPRKPLREIDSAQAAQILGIHRSSLSHIVNQPRAQEILRWRWSSEKRGKRLFEYESVIEYREATKDPEFGAELARANALRTG